jgi:uncharacterized membrane protein HdeD (DUF308 family)
MEVQAMVDLSQEFATRHWWGLLARGILSVLVGLIALVWPGIALLSLAILVGIFFLVSGFWEVYAALWMRRMRRPTM